MGEKPGELVLTMEVRHVLVLDGDPLYWIHDDGSIECIDCGERDLIDSWLTHRCPGEATR